MRTTEPKRWQDLLNQVAAITPETLKKFHEQEILELERKEG